MTSHVFAYTLTDKLLLCRVLLDHEVPEENINLVSLLMAESGVHTIAYAFPKVNIVTTAVDPEINEKFHVLPGIGNFGDRYFGTEPMAAGGTKADWTVIAPASNKSILNRH